MLVRMKEQHRRPAAETLRMLTVVVAWAARTEARKAPTDAFHAAKKQALDYVADLLKDDAYLRAQYEYFTE